MTDARSQAQNPRPKATLPGFLRDENAASAVFFALTIASIIGFVGLAVETGLWFAERRQYQTAADAGAIAGALQMADQQTNGAAPSLDKTETGSAWTESIRNGAATFVLNTSVQQLTSNGNAVAHVEVAEAKSPILAALALTGVTIKTVAEATVGFLGQPCLNALGTTGKVITVQGSANLNAKTCVLTSNSTSSGTSTANGNNPASVTIQGGNNAVIKVAQIYSLGTIIQGGSANVEAPMSGMNTTAAASNPFSSVTAPTAPAAPTLTTVTAANGSSCLTITSSMPASATFVPVCKVPAGKNPARGDVTLAATVQTSAGIVTVAGALTIPSGITLTVPAGSTLNVLGDLSVAGNLTVNGSLYVDGNVSSSGTTTLNTGLNIADTSNSKTHSLTVSGGTTSVTGAVKIVKGDFTVSGGTATVTGNVNLGSGNLSMTGGTTTLDGNVGLTSGSFSITGSSTTVNLNGTTTVVGSFSIGSGGTLKTKSGGSTSILLSGSTGSFNFNSNSTVNLTAPSSGTYKGIALYQDPASSNASNIGGSSFTMLGAVYAKSATVNFGGNASTTCALIIANTINLTGNSNLDATGCSNYGITVPKFYTVSLSD